MRDNNVTPIAAPCSGTFASVCLATDTALEAFRSRRTLDPVTTFVPGYNLRNVCKPT